MLHSVNKGDWTRPIWCAPGVLSILTGLPVRETHALLGRHIKKSAEDVKGVHIDAIILALYELGWFVRQVDLHARYTKPPTLKRFLRERPMSERLKMMLVLTNEHIGACHLNYYSDNITRVAMHQDNCFGAKRPVEQVWTLHRRAMP